MAANYDTRTTAEIYEEAAKVNGQVTDGLKNALRIVDDTRDVQAATLSELQKQGEELGEIQASLEDVQDDAKYAQTVLDDIGCLCWCFGGKKSNKIQRPVHRTKYTPPETKPATKTKPNEVQTMSRTETEGQAASKSKGTQTKKTGEESAIERIEEGKKEQDAILDQISDGLDVLTQGARAMGEELAAQDKALEMTEQRADDATQETKDTTRHSAFRRHVGTYM